MSIKYNYLIGEAEEYLCLRCLGAGEAVEAEAGAERAGRGDAGAELLSRTTPELVLRPPRAANNRNANCSKEPVKKFYIRSLVLFFVMKRV